MQTGLFFDLIKIAVGKYDFLLDNPTPSDWKDAFLLSKRHALVGVLFEAIRHLPKEQYPPKNLLFEWFILAENINKCNQIVNNDAIKVCDTVRNDGQRCLILKGQGIGSYYPKPHLRMPGDIDLWIEGGTKKVLKYLRSKGEVKNIVYTHSEFSFSTITDVEVHHNISFFYNPLYHFRLKKFLNKQSVLFENKIYLDSELFIYAPTVEFNRFYILLHIYRHYLAEGIGLRQFMDYYYVLIQGGKEDSWQRTQILLKKFGMKKFAKGVMWVMQKVFDLEDRYLLFSPNEKIGKKLLKDIILAGNFGQYDTRINWKNRAKLLPRVYESIKRKVRFICDYPLEVIFDIPTRFIMYLWKHIV